MRRWRNAVAAVTPALGLQFDVLVFDLPGHGLLGTRVAAHVETEAGPMASAREVIAWLERNMCEERVI